MKHILHTILFATLSCMCTFGGLMIIATSTEATVAVKKLGTGQTCPNGTTVDAHHAAVVAGKNCLVEGQWVNGCSSAFHMCHNAQWIGPGGDLDVLYGGTAGGYITNNP